MATFGQDSAYSRILEQALIESPARIFVADIDRAGRRPRVTLHASKAASSRKDRRELLKKLRHADEQADFRIKAHRLGSLERHRSLEEFLGKTAGGEIVFDPTAGFERSQKLVRFARQVRTALGSRLVGTYWSGDWRVLYVSLDSSKYVSDKKIKVAVVAETEKTVRRILRETCGEKAKEFVSLVKVGFGMPEIPVVPVDERARHLEEPVASRWAQAVGASALAAFVGIGMAGDANAADPETFAPAPAASLPAVSGLNGKIDLAIGARSARFSDCCFDAVNDDTVIVGTGSVSAPLGHRFGVQIDVGAGGAVDGGDTSFYGVGGHLFWRDPAVGLAGIIASYVSGEVGTPSFGPGSQDFDITRIGGEAELYLDQFTIYVSAGGQFGDIDGFNPTFDDGGFIDADLSWYLNENFVVSAGVESDSQSDTSFHAAAEWQPGMSGMSGLTVFFDGAVHDDENYRALGGVRYYFGESKSLIRRHREDDPRNNLIRSASSTGY